jgi:D-inositol-3-phosphate glycosyltransferase
MMRICLVHRDLHTVTRGGIGTVYAELGARLRDAGHHVTLVTQESPQPLSLPGTTTLTLPRTENLDAHRNAVAEILTALQPEIVECSTWEAEALHYLRRPRSARAPIVVRGEFSAATMHAADLVASERELVHGADAVLAVSDFAARDLASAYGIASPTVVANGVDRDRFRPGPITRPTTGNQVTLDVRGNVRTRTPLAKLSADRLPPPWVASDDRPRIIWLGKITPMKGWDWLETIAGRLRGCARMTVLLGHSHAFCSNTLSGDDVTILQDLSTDDLVSFYRAADWLVSTSRWEGFGLAIADALACGTPALLPADLGTAPELLAEGDGHIYADADELAAILTRPDKTAGCLPTRFDWNRNVSSTVEIYRAVTSTVGAR